MEFPAGETSDSVWSQMSTQTSPSRPVDPNTVQAVYENGFQMPNESENTTTPIWHAIWNSAVCCVRTVIENSADCHRDMRNCLQRGNPTVPGRVYGTQATSTNLCSTGAKGQLETLDRFAGASAPPHPRMERSINSNSDSPPYMPAGSRGISGNPQGGAEHIESHGRVSSHNGQRGHCSTGEARKRGRYSSQRHSNIRDLPV